jgi:hypothetical protein
VFVEMDLPVLGVDVVRQVEEWFGAEVAITSGNRFRSPDDVTIGTRSSGALEL